MTQTFEIKGIHCSSCQMLIEDILQDEGVKVTKFAADMKKQTALMTVDTKLSEDEIIEIIKSAGEYKVTLK